MDRVCFDNRDGFSISMGSIERAIMYIKLKTNKQVTDIVLTVP